MLRRELRLRALLVGVGPVEDLLLDEAALLEHLERRTGEVEVGVRPDGHEGVLLAAALLELFGEGALGIRELERLLLLAHRVVLALEELLGRIPPRSEVVLVEDDEVPGELIEPLMVRLEVAGGVAAHEVLEGAEEDERMPRVDGCRVAPGRARDVLPAIEVDMALEVGLPGVFDGRLEGDDEHAPGLETFGEVIGGEGLAETHLRVPEELGHGIRVFGPPVLEVGVGLLDGTLLLVAHAEGRVMRAGVGLAGAQFGDRGEHVVDRAPHPLEHRVGEALLHEPPTHLEVAEHRTLGAVRRLVDDDLVVLDRRRLELLSDAGLHVLRRLPDLEEAGVRLVVDRVRVDAEARLGFWREEVSLRLRHRQAPWGEPCSR